MTLANTAQRKGRLNVSHLLEIKVFYSVFNLKVDR